MNPSEAAERNKLNYPDVKLHSCPFCNSDHLYIYLNSPSSDVKPWPHVACLQCGAGHSTIEKWNTRSGQDCSGWNRLSFMGKPLMVHPDIDLEARHALLVAALAHYREDHPVKKNV